MLQQPALCQDAIVGARRGGARLLKRCARLLPLAQLIPGPRHPVERPRLGGPRGVVRHNLPLQSRGFELARQVEVEGVLEGIDGQRAARGNPVGQRLFVAAEVLRKGGELPLPLQRPRILMGQGEGRHGLVFAAQAAQRTGMSDEYLRHVQARCRGLTEGAIACLRLVKAAGLVAVERPLQPHPRQVAGLVARLRRLRFELPEPGLRALPPPHLS